MPVRTRADGAMRAANRAAEKTQPSEALLAAGCCPSCIVVDWSMVSEHLVYCEEPAEHDGPHRGLAGVLIPGWRTSPVPWRWEDEQ